MNGLLNLACLPPDAIPRAAREMARLSLFDWLTVARVGAQEPVAKILCGLVKDEAGKPAASVVGLSIKVPARAAALANGTISHALDYDDTHFAHIGHPSVAILPAALAVGEELDASGAAVLDAFLIGAEASIRIGMVLGRPHYDRGFHQTAIAGAFGATVAAARVMGLTRDQTRQALSRVATRASGLKSQFGSMGKPYNAGIAASNGVEAAALARRGFVSADDGVGGPQGFVDAHVDQAFEDAAWAAPPPATFLFEDVKHKLHACCHGLHAAIEALEDAKDRWTIEPGEVAAVSIRVNPRWLKVCDVKRPRTGLEAKFSYAMTAAMTLHGVDTAADRAYDDALCRDPRLTALAPRVEVAGDAALPDTGAVVRVELRGRPAVEAAHDLAARIAPETLERGLRAKAASLLGEAAAESLWRGASQLDGLSAPGLARLMNG
jgi:2-methylcitrate dehydratase PrpD